VPTPRCPVCGSKLVEPFLALASVPVLTTALVHDAQSALAATRGDITLAACARCGMIVNTSFDSNLVEYDGDYENSQFFSPAFRQYAEDLAASLVRRHAIHDDVVVEIGSGKGDFLALLCASGANRGIGFDPSYGGEIGPASEGLDIEFVPTLYDEHSAPPDAALICARHVLEHIPDPVGFLRRVRAGIRSDPLIYLEVPNAEFTLTASGVWDVIYQHCSYFWRGSLGAAVANAGFDVADVYTAFDGQFVALEARPGDASPPIVDRDSEPELEELLQRVERAAHEHRASVRRWESYLARHRPAAVALWGAGAKGVTFLNTVAPGAIEIVVDVNPRKAGSFVPGTGQPIRLPAELQQMSDPPAGVIVANSAYEDEIRHELTQRGITCEVLSL
jgi:Methyltransferase domain/C-methyltransferase C-terminal domain